MNKVALLSLFFSIGILHSQLLSQEINWVYLAGGETNADCISSSDPNQAIACFGLEYTPSVTGTMTSYTLGYIVDCVDELPSIDTSFSCVMDDATDLFSDCAAFGASLLSASGNSGNISVAEGIPLIIHQVCLNLGINDTIQVIADDITGATISIDLPGGDPVTDIATVPAMIMLTDTVYGLVSCVDTSVCSLSLDTTNNLVLFPTNINGNVLDGSSDTTTSVVFNLDIYDEENELCGISGGSDDVQITMQLLSTEDQYGYGKIDSLAGESHRIYQDSAGLVVDLPFGTNSDNETSTGDLRGFSMKVLFANHLEIMADQLKVNISGINDSSQAFESAALVFLDVEGVAFDTLVYNGFFEDGADLTGDCTSGTLNTNIWSTMGNGQGTFIISDQSSVDITDPCNIEEGTKVLDTLMIHARLDAGLDSATVVQGFELIVYGEDIAAPSVLDDGSGSGLDDGIAGNAPTSTSAVLTSKILGYSVDGCVFKQEILPVEMVSFEAKKINEEVLLEWVTTSEVNHSHFEVEWSTDGRLFSTIGEVSKGKTIVALNHYNHLHSNPEMGYNFYRIKQVDIDGRFEYSDIRSLAMVDAQASVSIYPNPVVNDLTIDFDEQLPSSLHLRILNVHGQEIYSQSLEAGVSSHTLSVDGFPLGQYIILVDSKPYRFVKN